MANNTGDYNHQLNDSTVGEDLSSSLFQLIDHLKQLTSNIVSRLDEATYEDMMAFIDARDNIITQIQKLEQTEHITLSPVLLSKYKNEINSILMHDTEIKTKLSAIQNETMEKITKSSAARKQRSAYDAAYSLDGVYFDKKN